jgi:DNA-binding response OmpR family regulator
VLVNEPKWLLIVEDEDEIATLLKKHFVERGFSVHSCTRSADAVRMLANQKFACVLLDMCLTTGSGEQVVTSMRQNPASLNFYTPIVVMSGALSRELVLQIKSSVSAFFVKPFSLDEILAKVSLLAERPKAST